MNIDLITPQNTVFVLLSFEGPDKYSTVGGLGIRMNEVSRILSEYSFETHFFFVGDPYGECGAELVYNHTYLHRWCQRISSRCPGGVYDGEIEKIEEWNRTIPDYIINQLVLPNAREGKLTVILAEDWHTAKSVAILDKKLKEKNLRNYTLIFWNINNEYGINNVDLNEIVSCCTITTVSKFMTARLKRKYGLQAIAIPNGIPKRILGCPSEEKMLLFRHCFDGLIMSKVARYEIEKGWISAIEALHILKERGFAPKLLIRGGAQSHRTDIICRIISLGLKFVSISLPNPNFESIIESFQKYRNFDIIEMDFFIPEEFLMFLYGSSDIVIANSIYEPFGIVGLEVMAKCGVSLLGSTGEDYAVNNKNCVRVASNLPEELADVVTKVMNDEELRNKIRINGFKTAKAFTWDRALSLLIYRLEKILKSYNVFDVKKGDGALLDRFI